MAERFNLTAQLHLQAPRNTSQVVGDIKRQLSGIEADVKVKGDSRSLAKINSEMQNIRKSTAETGKSVGTLNRNLSEAARRFSVITVATGTMLAFSRSIKDAVGEAIAFEREVIRISQVTGKSVKNLKGLTKEVTRLSTSLGVSAADLLNVSRTLAQAGFDANKTRKALDILAKTDLGATFDNLQDTTEGAIAVLRQFGNEARAVGGDIKFLEQTMDAINSVSKKFAVESGDLITVIRRTGGVFEAAGGSVNELIALFTSVRATTRESAETIATGLRTIFTRIQRTDTVDQLKALGIQLRDSEGQFVGAFEAVRRLSAGLSSLDPKDYRFSDIVESLGGFRQIGKVIPLIKQFAVAQDALNVAQSASGSVTRDAATAQQALSVQAGKVSEKFGELIRKFSDSSTFKSIAKFTLDLAKAFIAVADALTPLLPLLTTMIGLKIGKALAPGIGAVMGVGKRKASGGMVHGFAGGGTVPGRGNRDTVPAMLTPGEFVIRKSSVKKLGAQRLAQMNNNRYVGGGTVETGQFHTRRAKAHVSDPTVVTWTKQKKAAFEAGKHQAEPTDKLDFSTSHQPRRPRLDPKKYGQAAPMNLYKKFFTDKKAATRGNAWESLLKAGATVGPDKLTGEMPRFGHKTALDGMWGGTRADAALTDESHKLQNMGDKLFSDEILFGEKFKGSLLRRENPDTLRGEKSVEVVANRATAQKNNGPWAKKRKKATSATTPPTRRAALGGLIQRFAMGGIAKANRIGAAILDPDENRKNETKRIGPNSVKKHIGGSGFDRTRAQKGFGKVFPGKDYTLVRQGLNEKTSIGFKSDLLSGAAQGIGDATAGLSSDLGLGSASFQGDAKSEMQKYLGTTAIGELYEAGVNMLENQGAFKNTPAGAPVDFPGGLSGRLADNFDKLPSTWVDAKSSYAAASVGGMFNKVSMELADEYERSGEWAKAAKSKAKKAKGGGISGSDRVPALLTPGEFVFNKSSAQSIGYSNLSKMNQRGVQGFAAGGTVGWKRFHNAGRVPDGDLFPPGVGAGARPQSGLSQSMGGGLMGIAQKQESADHGAMEKKMDALNRMEASFKAVGLEGDDLKKALGVAKEAFNKGAGTTEAVERGMKSLVKPLTEEQKARMEANKAQGKYRKALGRASASVQGGLGKVKHGAARVGATAKKLQPAAQGAQQFAFFGGAMTAAAVQMSGLSDATKQAATETIGFATAVLGIGGTLVDMLGGLSTIGEDAVNSTKEEIVEKIKGAAAEKINSASTVKNTAAGNANTASEVKNTVATNASTVSTNKDIVATNISAATEGTEAAADTTEAVASFGAAVPLIALIAIVAGVVLVMKYFAAQATAAADALSKERSTLIEGLEQGKGGVSARDRAKATVGEELAFRDKATERTGGMYGAAIGGGVAIAGAVAIGASFGSVVPVVGTLVGALVGAAVGMYLMSSSTDEANAAREREISAIHGSIDAIHRLGAASRSFDDAMSDIDLAQGLAPEERVERRLTAQKDLSGEISSSNVDAEFSKLESLAQKAGKSIVSLTEADFDEGSADFHAFNLATKAVTQGQDQLSKATKAARDTLAEAASIELTGEKSWEEVSTGTGLFAQSLRAAQEAIKAENATKIKALQAEAVSIRSAAKVRLEESWQTADDQKQYQDELARAANQTKEVTKIENRQGQQLKDLNEIYKAQNDAAHERREADLRAAAAADEMAAALRESRKFLMGLNELERAVGTRDKNLSNEIARDTGKSMDFSVEGLADLNNIDMVKNVKQFDRDLQSVVKLLPASMQKEAGKMVDTVVATANVFGKGKDDVLAKYKTRAEGEFGEAQQKQLIADAGIDISKLPDKIAEKMLKDIEKSGGKISSADFDEIFKPIKTLGESAAQNLQKIEDIRNKEIVGYAKYLSHIDEERKKQINLERKVLSSRQKAQELLARARGKDVSRVGMDATRTRAAQFNLRGTTATAGDLPSLRAASLAAKNRRKAISDEIKNTKLSIDARKKLMDEDTKLAGVVSQVTGELERLGDQSEKAAEIMGKIDEEKEKRETIRGIVEEFVVGGGDERQQMFNAAAGVRQAYASGTLQMQNPEQRAATVGLLDKLENIFIGNTGMTGKQMKQELIFRDAIKMGLDPSVAKMLATATSKEEQLISELEKLTNQMVRANEVNADLARSNRDLIQGNNAPGVATGGRIGSTGTVYRAGGGSIFKKRGTDTVPAMLTPGEFVVKKSSVDKIGAPALNALNSGHSPSVQNFAGGGMVSIMNGGAYTNIAQGGFGTFPTSGSFLRFLRGEDIGDFESGQSAYSAWSSALKKGTFDKTMSMGTAVPANYDLLAANSGAFDYASSKGARIKKPLGGLGKFSGRLPDPWFNMAAPRIGPAIDRVNPLTGLWPFLKQSLAGSDWDAWTSSGSNEVARRDAVKFNSRNFGSTFGVEEWLGLHLFKDRVMGYNPLRPLLEVAGLASNTVDKMSYAQQVAGDYQGAAARQNAINAAAFAAGVIPGFAAAHPGSTLIGGVSGADALSRVIFGGKTSPGSMRDTKQVLGLGMPKPLRPAFLYDGSNNVAEAINNAPGAKYRRQNWDPTQSMGVPEKMSGGSTGVVQPVGSSSGQGDSQSAREAMRSTIMRFYQAMVAKRSDPNYAMGANQAGGDLEGARKMMAQSEDAVYGILMQAAQKNPIGNGAIKSINHSIGGRSYASKKLLEDFKLYSSYMPGVAGKYKNGPIADVYYKHYVEPQLFGTPKTDHLDRLDRLRSVGADPSNIKEEVDAFKYSAASGKMKDIEKQYNRISTSGSVAPGIQTHGEQRDLLLTDLRDRFLSLYENELLKVKYDQSKKQIKEWARGTHYSRGEYGRIWGREEEKSPLHDLASGTSYIEAGSKEREEAVHQERVRRNKKATADAAATAATAVAEKQKQVGQKKKELWPGDPNAILGPTKDDLGGVMDPNDVSSLEWQQSHQPLTNADQDNDYFVSQAEWLAFKKSEVGVAAISAERQKQSAVTTMTSSATSASNPLTQHTPTSANDLGGASKNVADVSATKETFTAGGRAKTLDLTAPGLKDPSKTYERTGSVYEVRPGTTSQDPWVQFLDKDKQKFRIKFSQLSSKSQRDVEVSDIFQQAKRENEGAGGNWQSKAMAVGGGVSGVDSVPAMLTPGEFVMSPEAVTRHGVGYMKNLNRGRIPGFRRGGLIGQGNVQYKQNGGLLSQAAGAIMNLDPSAVKSVLETFTGDFGSTLDKLMTPFMNLGSQLTAVANAFSSMVMTHNFSGDLSLNVNIGNKDAIIEAVRVGIEPSLQGLITNMVNESIKELRDSAG